MLALVFCLFFPTQVRADAQPQAPEYVTNLGVNVLSRANLIVAGTLSKTVKNLNGVLARDIVVESVLWGATDAKQLTVMYAEAAAFSPSDDRVAVALEGKADATSLNLLGKRVPLYTPATEAALVEYLAIEKSRDDRKGKLDALEALLEKHLKAGSDAGRFAAVELIFFIKNHPARVTHKLYSTIRPIRASAEPKTAADMGIALRGMVETILMPDARVAVVRGEDAALRATALKNLNQYLEEEPAAFTRADIELCDTFIRLAPDEASKTGLQRHKKKLAAAIANIERNGPPAPVVEGKHGQSPRTGGVVRDGDDPKAKGGAGVGAPPPLQGRDPSKQPGGK